MSSAGRGSSAPRTDGCSPRLKRPRSHAQGKNPGTTPQPIIPEFGKESGTVREGGPAGGPVIEWIDSVHLSKEGARRSYSL